MSGSTIDPGLILAGVVAGRAILPSLPLDPATPARDFGSVIGYATPLLPYQAAPIVSRWRRAACGRAGMVLCLALAAVTLVVLAPLDYVWFRVLGWIG